MYQRLQQAKRNYLNQPTLNNRFQYYRLKRYARRAGHHLPLEVRVLRGHTGPVWSGVFDGTEILSASRDRTLRVWDRETGETIHLLGGHTDGVQ